MSGCKFCELRDHPDARDFGSVYALADGYPVAAGHTLVIPFRHCPDFFQMEDTEIVDTATAMRLLAASIAADGFNVGWNCGEAAGQTVPHAHAHLIPRRWQDVPDPFGGIRGVIPANRRYLP